MPRTHTANGLDVMFFAILICILTQDGVEAASPAWLRSFSSRNNVTVDVLSGVHLQGWTKNANLAPSAGLLSVYTYDGDIQLNVTLSAYDVVQSGYQAQVSLFMAPANYTLQDYLSWPDSNLINQQQLAYTRVKVYPTIDYTWGSMFSAAGPNSSYAGAGQRLQQGVLSISRKAGRVSGFLQVGSSGTPAVYPSLPMATGPVLLGIQVLYGFNFSVTISNVSIAYRFRAMLSQPSPPPPPPLTPPSPPPPPPAPSWSSSSSPGSWLSLFERRNNVTFDNATGTARFVGFTQSSAALAPSAGLLTVEALDGDIQMNVSISAYEIVQSGYQASISLFFAPTGYTLQDYVSWPDSDAIARQQAAYVRVKVFPTIDYTFGSTFTSVGPNSSEAGATGRLQQGILGISRKSGQVSGFLQVGSNPPSLFKPMQMNPGPVLLGIQVVYGFNFSVTISNVSVTYGSRSAFTRPSPPPPSPPPPPPPPPPPACAATPAEPVTYPGGYRVMGVGGGGAMSSLSMSPFNDLWLVGTDMGTLYRSTNRGATWEAISQLQMKMTNDMPWAPPVGFSADGQTLFFAPCWDPSKGMPCVAKRSTDGGVTWDFMDVNAGGATVFNIKALPWNNKRPVKYWVCSTQDANLCYAATSAGLDRTSDKGLTWKPVNSSLLNADSRGSFLDGTKQPPTMFHATPTGIYSWPDGQPEKVKLLISANVTWFDAGRDSDGLTLAYIDADSSFCSQMLANVSLGDRLDATLKTCGRMWISTNGGAAFQPTQHYTYKVHMADNNGRIVYSVPHRDWGRNYGVRVWRTDVPPAGAPSTTKVFDQVDLDNHYALWPSDKLEYSAVGLDVGYWDGGYYSFHVNQLNALEAGGSENFFLHVTRDGGQHWQSPFTRFRDCGARAAGKRWSSTGLEPTSFYTVAIHPTDPRIIYAGAADIKGIVSEDSGDTWRVMDPKQQAAPNSIYGFAFDPQATSRVFVATAKWHDYPNSWYANPLNGNGGIFVSEDRGRTFICVAAASSASCDGCNDMVNDFLTVAYDAAGDYLYAGGHINGIARIKLATDSQWQWINFNLLGNDLWQNETIIPRIQIDPDNGDVYALLTGNRAYGMPRNMLNQARTGIYVMPRGGVQWQLLRGVVNGPAALAGVKLWQYPTSFAVDWSSGSPGNRTHMLLTDYINNGQQPGSAGIWKSSDGGATWWLKQQSDWAADVKYDPKHPTRVYATGARSLDPWGQAQPGNWGFGGFMYSDNGGETWTAAESHPYQAAMNSVTVDPRDSCNVWFATGGGGVLYGPAPNGLPDC